MTVEDRDTYMPFQPRDIGNVPSKYKKSTRLFGNCIGSYERLAQRCPR